MSFLNNQTSYVNLVFLLIFRIALASSSSALIIKSNWIESVDDTFRANEFQVVYKNVSWKVTRIKSSLIHQNIGMETQKNLIPPGSGWWTEYTREPIETSVMEFRLKKHTPRPSTIKRRTDNIEVKILQQTLENWMLCWLTMESKRSYSLKYM